MNSIPHLIHRLWQHFSKKRKMQFYYVLVLMLIASFSEVLSLGAVLPFLAALADPNYVYTHKYFYTYTRIFIRILCLYLYHYFYTYTII